MIELDAGSSDDLAFITQSPCCSGDCDDSVELVVEKDEDVPEISEDDVG